MSIYEDLSRNAAAVALRLSSLTDCTEKGTFELPIDLYDDKQLSSLVSKDTELEIDYDVVELDRFKDSYDINFDFRLKNREFKYSSISLIFKFHGFNDDNFIMIPSHFYGNIREADNLGSANKRESYKGKAFAVSECSIPGMGFYNPIKKVGFFIYFKESTLKGSEQIGFKENQDNKVSEFFLGVPLEINNDPSSEENIKIGLRVVFTPCKDLGTFYNIYFDSVEDIYKNSKLNNSVSMSYKAEKSFDIADFENKSATILQSAVNILQSILKGDREVLSNYSDDLDELITKILLKDISLETEGTGNNTAPIYRIEDIDTSYFISKCLLYLYHEDERLIKGNWVNTFEEFGQRLVQFADKEVLPYLGKKLESGFNKSLFCISLGIFPAVLAYWGHYLKNNCMVSKAEEVAEKLYRITFECQSSYKGIFNIEWSYMLTESFVTLYEATGKKAWLDKGIMAVSFLSTFHTEFNQGIPEEFSGNALFRLFLYTMDMRYISLLRKILNSSDESSDKIQIGLLTYLEVPGLYINPSEGMIAAVDNIDAKVLDRRNDKLRIVITNHTNYHAKVRTLAHRNTDFNNTEYGFYIPPLGEIYLGPRDTKVLSF